MRFASARANFDILNSGEPRAASPWVYQAMRKSPICDAHHRRFAES
jgi:hypothetical protein